MLRFLTRFVLAVVILAVLLLVGLRIAAGHRENATVAELLLPDSQVTETIHGDIHALYAGPEDGQPIVLIHGSVGWSGLWRETMNFLADAGYRVIAIDMPPMGLSERFPGMNYSRQAQALRILAFVETLGIKPIIVAHSFGAGAAMEAVMIDPEDFAGAVVIAGAMNLGQSGETADLPVPLRPKVMREAALAATVTNPYASSALFKQFVFQRDAITGELLEVLNYPMRRNGTTAALADWVPTLLVPPDNALSTQVDSYAALAVPVALIWGREDTVTPPLQAESLQQALGTATIFWMDQTGHIPQVEAPDLFHQLLGEALANITEG